MELAWQNFSLQPKEVNGPCQEADDTPQEIDASFQEADGPLKIYVFLPVEKTHVKFVKSDVLYIQTEKSKHAVYIYEEHKKTPRLVQRSMSDIESHFTAPDFFRLSRSVIINLTFVERISGSHLYLERLTSPFSIPEKTRPELMRRLGFRL